MQLPGQVILKGLLSFTAGLYFDIWFVCDAQKVVLFKFRFTMWSLNIKTGAATRNGFKFVDGKSAVKTISGDLLPR